jgi:superfamily II DNA/RNA helicase
MKSFADIGVCRQSIEKLAERSILEPTEIQERVIPLLKAGRDLAFRSATGTGKTFAYLLPILEWIAKPAAEDGPSRGKGPTALICAPTYELSAQIKGEVDFLGSAFSPSVKAALLTGDANIARQMDKLKNDKPAVIVGTPGRILQLERMGKLRLGAIRWLVLDEADRLTADELLDTTTALVGRLATERVTVACSATLPRKAREKMRPFLAEDALSEEADDAAVLRSMIEHWAFFSEGRRKISALRSFIAAAKPTKTLVFTDRGGQVGNIVGQLRHHGLPATGLYGDMDKVERKKAMDDFRAGRATVLVTSDLASRGLDIPDVSHVVALDVPETGDAYAHRAGRTARAGRQGIMTTIGDEIELPRLAALEKKLGIAVYPKMLYRGEIRVPEPIPEGEAERAESVEDLVEYRPPRPEKSERRPRGARPSDRG